MRLAGWRLWWSFSRDIRVTGWLDEEQTAVNSGVLNVSLTLRSEFFS